MACAISCASQSGISSGSRPRALVSGLGSPVKCSSAMKATPRPSTTSSPALAAPTPTMSTTSTSTSASSTRRVSASAVRASVMTSTRSSMRAKVITCGVCGGANDFLKVGAVGVEDIVGPVRLENTAMCFVVLQVRGDAISAIKDGEEVWDQVDQHRPRRYCVWNFLGSRAARVAPHGAASTSRNPSEIMWHNHSTISRMDCIRNGGWQAALACPFSTIWDIDDTAERNGTKISLTTVGWTPRD